MSSRWTYGAPLGVALTFALVALGVISVRSSVTEPRTHRITYAAPATPSPTPTEPPTPVPTPVVTAPPRTLAPTVAPPTLPPRTLPPVTPRPTAAPVRPSGLALGASGPQVTALQQRLRDLGYWLPAVSGTFDDGTLHAVVAFQKVAGLPRDGIVGAATQRALQSAVRPHPRTTTGHTIEIDLARQVLLVVTNGRVDHVFDTSTGRDGLTFPGRFAIFRQVDGYDHSPLGILYRPKYFVGGRAIHGYTSVPPYPASHGCVRVTYAAIDWIWANNAMPIGVQVWVY